MSHGHFFNNYFGGTGNSFNISQNMYTMHQHHAPPTATPPDQYNAYYSDNKATRQGQQTKAAKVYFEEGDPDQDELTDLAESVIPFIQPYGIEWFGDKLRLPRFHTMSIKHDEKTLYAQVSRILQTWLEADERNDRTRLAELLRTMDMYTIATRTLRHKIDSQ